VQIYDMSLMLYAYCFSQFPASLYSISVPQNTQHWDNGGTMLYWSHNIATMVGQCCIDLCVL